MLSWFDKVFLTILIVATIVTFVFGALNNALGVEIAGSIVAGSFLSTFLNLIWGS